MVRTLLWREPTAVLVIVAGGLRRWTHILLRRLQLPAHRLIVVPRLSADAFPALLRALDIVLDTFPFGAGLTALETFAVATPLVTLLTNDVRGAIAGSCYRQMGYTELIAPTIDAYIRVAGELIRDAQRRRTARWRIVQASHRLFDAAEAVAAWERLLLDVARRHGILAYRLRAPVLPAGHHHTDSDAAGQAGDGPSASSAPARVAWWAPASAAWIAPILLPAVVSDAEAAQLIAAAEQRGFGTADAPGRNGPDFTVGVGSDGPDSWSDDVSTVLLSPESDTLVRALVAAVAKHVRVPRSYAEPLQVVRARAPTARRWHPDDACCQDGCAGLAAAAAAAASETRTHHGRVVARRQVGVLVHLNDEFVGGATLFPAADLTFAPHAGDGLVFYTTAQLSRQCHPRGVRATAALTHGVQYSAVVWFLDAPYQPPE